MKLHRKWVNHSSAVQHIPSESTFSKFEPVEAGDTVKNCWNRQFLLRPQDQQPLRLIGCIHLNCLNPRLNSCLTALKCWRDSAAWWIESVIGLKATLWGRQWASWQWIVIVWLFDLAEPSDAANADECWCISALYWALWPLSSEFR